MVGAEPDEVVSRPKEGVFIAKGEYLGGQLQLEVKQLRIDWHLRAIPIKEEPQKGYLPIVGDLEVLKGFAELMRQWLVDAPRLIRMAFGAIFLEPAADRVFGYRRLDGLLSQHGAGVVGIPTEAWQGPPKLLNLAGVELEVWIIPIGLC